MAELTAAILSAVIETVLVDPNNRIGGNLLGQYTLEGGQTLTAITIGNPGAVRSTTGLEVVIPLMPTPAVGGTDHHLDVQNRWDITLVEHLTPPVRSPKLPEAIRRLQTLFTFYMGKTVSGVFVDADTLLGSYPQYTLTVFSNQFIDVRPLLSAYAQGLT